MPEPQPRPTPPQPENPAPPEREPRRPYSPEASRMIMSVTSRELLHPENKLTEPHKQRFRSEMRNKTDKDLPTKAIADISGESRNQDSDTYEDWSAKVKNWYDGQDAPAKEKIKGAFTALGIELNDTMEQTQIDTFFDKYLDMDGTPEDYKNRYELFVKDFLKELVDEGGKLDRRALNERIDVMKPLLISFGQKDIVSVIDAHIQAHGFVSQKVETRNSQAEEVLSGAERPVTDQDSIKGFKKLAQKMGVSVTPDNPETPPGPPEQGKIIIPDLPQSNEEVPQFIADINNSLAAAILERYGVSADPNNLTDQDKRILIDKFDNPQLFLQHSRELIREIMKEESIPEAQRRQLVQLYVDAYTSLQLDLDHFHFKPNRVPLPGVPAYIPDHFVDMGSDSTMDATKRYGREKILVDKATSLEMAKPLLYEIFMMDPSISRADWKKLAAKRISEYVYTSMPYNYDGEEHPQQGMRTISLDEIQQKELAVCRHQALMRQILNQTAGITSLLMKSDVDFGNSNGKLMAHANNLVRIEGQWYLDDTTNPRQNGDGSITPFFESVDIPGGVVDFKNNPYHWEFDRPDWGGRKAIYNSRNNMFHYISEKRPDEVSTVPPPASEGQEAPRTVGEVADALLDYEMGTVNNRYIDLEEDYKIFINNIIRTVQTNPELYPLDKPVYAISNVARVMMDRIAERSNDIQHELAFTLQGGYLQRPNGEPIYIVALAAPAMDFTHPERTTAQVDPELQTRLAAELARAANLGDFFQRFGKTEGGNPDAIFHTHFDTLSTRYHGQPSAQDLQVSEDGFREMEEAGHNFRYANIGIITKKDDGLLINIVRTKRDSESGEVVHEQNLPVIFQSDLPQPPRPPEQPPAQS